MYVFWVNMYKISQFVLLLYLLYTEICSFNIHVGGNLYVVQVSVLQEAEVIVMTLEAGV